MRCPHCDDPIDDAAVTCPVCNKDVRPVARRATTSLDPSAALADLESPTSTVPRAKKTKRCPFCAEVILAEAIVCKHCRSDLNKPPKVTKPLPFPAIPGATPTSGLVYFLLILLVSFLLLLSAPVVFWVGIVATMIWVGFDASKHRLAEYESELTSPTIACLGTIALWIIVFPLYLGIRSRIRAGVQPVKAV